MTVLNYLEQVTQHEVDVEAALISTAMAVYCEKNNIEDPLDLFDNSIDKFRMYVIFKAVQRKLKLELLTVEDQKTIKRILNEIHMEVSIPTKFKIDHDSKTTN